MPGGWAPAPRFLPGLLSCLVPSLQDRRSDWGGAGTSCSFGEVGAATLPKGSCLCPSEGNQRVATLARGQSSQGGCALTEDTLPLPGEPEVPLSCLSQCRFHSSKSGKIYLHDDIRLLFSRKSIEVDSGIPYELKSFTEMPRNPCYSPRA